MKSLVKRYHRLSFYTRKYCRQLILFMALSLPFHTAVIAQTAELEIIGKRNQPFTITLGGEVVPGEPVSRTVLTLGEHPVPVTITFRDPALGSIKDTIIPAIGSRLVYRIAEADLHKAIVSGGFFAKIKALFSADDTPVPISHQPTFSLKYLEKLPITEPIKTEVEISKNPQDPNAPTIRISADYQFSRDSTQRVHRQQDTLIATTTQVGGSQGKDSSAAAAVVPQIIKVLTLQQHQAVISNLTNLKFEEDKVQYLQRALKDVSLTSEQLSGILRQFDFERSKLQVCRQYYHQLSDKENAESLFSVFDFDSTRQELKKWINDQPR